MKKLPIQIEQNYLRDFCQRNQIRRLSLFGSVLREDFGPDSDIDVLVEFHPGAKVGFLDLAGMEIELSESLGRRVDLNTPGFLSPLFADQVMREAVELHVAA